MGYMNNGNEDRSRRQDMGYGMESNTEYDMEPKMGEDADYDGKRGPDSDAGSDAAVSYTHLGSGPASGTYHCLCMQGLRLY